MNARVKRHFRKKKKCTEVTMKKKSTIEINFCKKINQRKKRDIKGRQDVLAQAFVNLQKEKQTHVKEKMFNYSNKKNPKIKE